MSKFLTPTVLQVLRGQFREGRQLWELQQDVRYQSDIMAGIFPDSDGTIVVPKGFITDLASVPRVPVAWLLAGGLADEPAVIHDWLYTVHTFQGQPISRKTADDVLREAIGVSDGEHAPGWLIWAAVRVGGSGSWGAPGPAQPAHILPLLPAL